MRPTTPRWRDHLFGLALCVAYVAVLLHTSRGLAMTRDESFYVVAAERYGDWFRLLWNDGHTALTRSAIDEAWSYNSEHPALAKSLFALSWLAQQKWHPFPLESMAYRFPGMLLAGLLLWLTYIFATRACGRSTGVFAALALGLMPQFFYHSHLDCFDVPIAFMLVLCTYAYWRSLTRALWIPVVGLTYGLALATKHNAWILPGVLLIHWLWAAGHEIAAPRRSGVKSFRLAPWWLLSMLVLGPMVFVGSWPWLWNGDPAAPPDAFVSNWVGRVLPWESFWNEGMARAWNYGAFHLQHIHYDIEYFGENLFRPPFPVSYPFVMTLFTISLTTSVLAAGGLFARLRTLLPRSIGRRLGQGEPTDATIDPTQTDVLLLGSLLAPLAVIAYPTTPVFGGTKHWLAAFPFLATYAGIGFSRFVELLRERIAYFGRRPTMAGLVSGALLLSPAVVETAHENGFGMAMYTFAAGGVPGAADYGMNRQFWGFTTGKLAPWFREHLPHGGSVWVCDTTRDAWRMLQRDGLVPANIRAAPDVANADYAIVQHQLHFNEVDYQIWQAYGSVRPVYVLSFDGVPIASVYENPRARGRRR